MIRLLLSGRTLGYLTGRALLSRLVLGFRCVPDLVGRLLPPIVLTVKPNVRAHLLLVLLMNAVWFERAVYLTSLCLVILNVLLPDR